MRRTKSRKYLVDRAQISSAVSFRANGSVIEISFLPGLTPAQYSELCLIMDVSNDYDQLLEHVRTLVLRWNVTLAIHHLSL
ncbi:hypothetical protein ETAA8_39680 [Anatilimnocola aggregata]|uniref:Uncharacterized protein n=1 Tax=Anatilimnocola aggregata TaxID=2528021 RepID=A0A517YFD8_9BACT|nr:hypothetical protein ETAA8_39680 [Anatilimnocola aggregata]